MKNNTRSLITFILLFIMTVSVVLGRIETFDLTEGQALVEGFYYWLSTVAFGLAAILVRLIPVEDNQDFVSSLDGYPVSTKAMDYHE